MLAKSIQQALPNGWVIFNDKDLLRGSGHSRDYKSPSHLSQNSISRTCAAVLYSVLYARYAILRVWMCAEIFRGCISLASFRQYLHYTDQFFGVVTRIVHEADSQII